jgi:hypothetical protein
MDIRNPQYNSIGTIDCEIEHPVYGWIPFTASPDDVEEHGRAIYDAALAMGPADYIPPPAPTLEEILAAARASASLTCREFFLGLDAMGMYDTVMGILDDPDVPRAVKIELETATSFERMWPTLVQMAVAMGVTDAQLDKLFGIEVPQ